MSNKSFVSQTIVVSVLMRGDHLDERALNRGSLPLALPDARPPGDRRFRSRFLRRRAVTRLRITIKALGARSRSMQDLRPGDLVLAEGPYGALTGRRRRRYQGAADRGRRRYHSDANALRDA